MSEVGRAAVAASVFRMPGSIDRIVAHGEGLIHDSYRVDVVTLDGRERFLLQRINRGVFADVGGLMRNIESVLDHLHAVGEAGEDAYPTLVRTLDGNAWLDDDGSAWRMMSYVEGSTSIDRAPTAYQAGEIGCAFGRFLRHLSSFPASTLIEVLPRYRDTRCYLERFERAIAQDVRGRKRSARAEIASLQARRDVALGLQRLWQSRALPVRPVHGDTKLNNVLFDAGETKALCVIDFDTVGHGLLLHDVGDCVRDLLAGTAAARGYLTNDDVMLVEALLRGYMRGTGVSFSSLERDCVIDAAASVTLELAVRFLTDYLEGDAYFRVCRDDENLKRARCHIVLAELLETHRERLDDAVRSAFESI